MSNTSISNRSFLIPIAIAGITGQCFLSIYFSGALVPKELITVLNSAAQLNDILTRHQSVILLDAWLMGFGSFLSVIFYVGLVYISGAMTRFSGLLSIIASSALLAVALMDITFMVAAAVPSSDMQIQQGLLLTLLPAGEKHLTILLFMVPHLYSLYRSDLFCSDLKLSRAYLDMLRLQSE
jgi:hypothetical protein